MTHRVMRAGREDDYETTVRFTTAVAFIAAVFVAGAPESAAAADETITSSVTLTADHQGSIIIGSSGITLDCAGHSITGPGFAGVDIRNVTGVTVKNCHVSGFGAGFFLLSAPGNRLENNVTSGNEHEGFVLVSSPANDDNTLVGNTSTGNGAWGFAVYDGTTDTTLTGNTARSNSFAGFFVGLDSNRTTLSQNVSLGNSSSGFDIDSDNNTVIGNTATNNQSLGFLVFQANDNVFNSNVARQNVGGWVVAGSQLRNSFRNSFTANVASDNALNGFVVGNGAASARLNANIANGNASQGFLFTDVSDVLSQHDQAQGNGNNGFLLNAVSASTLTHDLAIGNEHGFITFGSSGNLFSQDVANNNHGFGFGLTDGSSGNTVSQSVAHNNPFADAADFNPAGANTWTDNSFGTTFRP
jgi:parallel beta-helix repeat protein